MNVVIFDCGELYFLKESTNGHGLLDRGDCVAAVKYAADPPYPETAIVSRCQLVVGVRGVSLLSADTRLAEFVV